MRNEDDSRRAFLAEEVKSGEAGADTEVARDFAVFHRHIVVNAD